MKKVIITTLIIFSVLIALFVAHSIAINMGFNLISLIKNEKYVVLFEQTNSITEKILKFKEQNNIKTLIKISEREKKYQFEIEWRTNYNPFGTTPIITTYQFGVFKSYEEASIIAEKLTNYFNLTCQIKKIE